MAYNHHVPIETLDAFLLTRSWHDHRDGLRLVFWCASERGPVRLRLTQQEAVMFVERHIPSEAGRRKPLELTSFFGRPVDALYFDTQRELARERERIRDTLGWTLKKNIKPDERFLMERFVTGAPGDPCHERPGDARQLDPRPADPERTEPRHGEPEPSAHQVGQHHEREPHRRRDGRPDGDHDEGRDAHEPTLHPRTTRAPRRGHASGAGWCSSTRFPSGSSTNAWRASRSATCLASDTS